MTRTVTLVLIGAAIGVLLAATVGELDAKRRKKPGCPSGTQAFAGVCIDRQSRPPLPFDDALADCADEGKRLPTGAELDAFRLQPGVVLGETPGVLEWTGDVFDEDQTLAITDPGFRGNQGQTATNTRYRCVR